MKRRNEPLVVPGLALDLEQFWHYSLSAKLKGEGGSNPDKNLDGFFLHESANDPNDGWSIVERIALRPHVDDDGQSDDKHIFLGSDAASVGYRQIRTRFELLQGEVDRLDMSATAKGVNAVRKVDYAYQLSEEATIRNSAATLVGVTLASDVTTFSKVVATWGGKDIQGTVQLMKGNSTTPTTAVGVAVNLAGASENEWNLSDVDTSHFALKVIYSGQRRLDLTAAVSTTIVTTNGLNTPTATVTPVAMLTNQAVAAGATFTTIPVWVGNLAKLAVTLDWNAGVGRTGTIKVQRSSNGTSWADLTSIPPGATAGSQGVVKNAPAFSFVRVEVAPVGAAITVNATLNGIAG